MQEKPTYELDEMLKNIKNEEELSAFYKDNSEYLADDKKGFYYYMKDMAESKNIFLKDLYSFAGVSEKYGEKILRMEKHTKNRDLIIRLCIAGHFLLDELNRALKLYGMTPLYAKDKRDACLIVAVNNRIYDLADIDKRLTDNGFIKLSVDE